MLTIRLFRVGRKNQPAFKIVVCDKRNAASRGRFVEEVGFYNPLTKQRNLKGDRVKYWMSVGAKPSPTVHNMLVADNVVQAPKIAKHKASKVKTGETPKSDSVASGQEQIEQMSAEPEIASEAAPAAPEAPAAGPAQEEPAKPAQNPPQADAELPIPEESKKDPGTGA